ncbi:unnamed protein product [Linum tenue]|uniref:Fe2OG dioxygenase domain-containing protein n=2 Tax=Linum tenue TaxID=586396 RepID=A0AAV0HAY4_9ROSI|nr:unnamed protein product [Linum tenue]
MEGSELTKLGSSLPVACVQELAKEPLRKLGIPPRYIRPDQHPPNATLPLQLPVIDLHKLSTSHHDDEGGHNSTAELDRLHNASKHWGFFQLINHGVSESLVDRVKAEVEGFFNLPMEEKQKYWQRPGEIEGFGQAFVVSEEQKLDWGDIFFTTALPKHLRKPHLFPNLPLPLRETLEEYSAALKTLALTILNLMAKSLGMDQHDIGILFEQGWQTFRMNYYPPCPQPELVMGLNSHSDAVGLTILLQLTADTQGLQIKQDGHWVPVVPLPNAFIINIGDILEIVSNGIYKSIEHRATVNSDKERISLATFLSPKLDGDLGPAPSLLKNTLSQPEFRRISVADYYKGYFSRELVGKSYVDTMRIHNG